MRIPIERIVVDKEERVRVELGDIAGLRDSISKLGLLNPIVIDENDRLVAGYRRLTACRELGWREVDVRIVSFEGDLLRELDAEVAENVFRKDFTPAEVERIEQRRRRIIRMMRGNIFQRIWRWLLKLFRRRPKKADSVREGSGPVRGEEPSGR